ncbi:MAG TPA: PilZ domain-containing protein [Burkholderiaceae bacterium]|jgi:c-di-GMP-binding flagellar brake protein YcgR
MNKTINAPSQDRREYIRVTPEPDAPIRVDISGADFIETIKAVDISENGVGIIVQHGFHGCHVDQPAIFVIHLPQPINKFFRVEGMIRHVRNHSFGVHFTNLNDKSRALVRQYIAHGVKKRGWWNYIRYVMGILH